MTPNRTRILVQTLRKLELFAGLTPAQVESLLRLCRSRRIEAGAVLSGPGAEPDSLFILLSGRLGVVSEDGSVVASLTAVTTVGEVDMVVRQPRRASVEALEVSNLLALPLDRLEMVLAGDPQAGACVYRNLSRRLAGRIIGDNVRMRDYLAERVRLEERVRGARRRAEVAVDLAVSEAGLSRRRAEALVDQGLSEDAPLRILIVDDEAEMRQLLHEVLADYDVIEARDGEEALAEIGEEAPDLVVTDIRMPGMDGYELVRELRRRFPHTPVLGISGYVHEEEVAGHDFDAFLHKPMNLRRFRDLVDVALGDEE